MNADNGNTVEATAERVLPIGTVVTVSSNRDLLMIVGRGVVARTKDGEGWCDYAAVLYPQGFAALRDLYGRPGLPEADGMPRRGHPRHGDPRG